MKDFLLVLKYKIIDPFNNFKTRRTIVCPNCYKTWYQFKKYKPGQITLCKKCRKEDK